MRRDRGLALLEVLVALVILSLVVGASLELFHGSHRLMARSVEWSSAVTYAVEAIEQAKIDSTPPPIARTEALPGGFRRQVTRAPWQPGLALVTVTILLPTGGRFELNRLLEVTSHATQ